MYVVKSQIWYFNRQIIFQQLSASFERYQRQISFLLHNLSLFLKYVIKLGCNYTLLRSQNMLRKKPFQNPTPFKSVKHQSLCYYSITAQCGKIKNLLSLKIFRQINSLVTSFVKTLLSRNFCQRCVTVKFRNFHTVCTVFKDQKFR